MSYTLRSLRGRTCSLLKLRINHSLNRSFFSAISTVQRRNNQQHETKIHAPSNFTLHHSSTGLGRSQKFSTNKETNTFRGYDLSSPECNVPPTIASRIGTKLHLQPKHPLNTIKTIIEQYWQERNGFAIRDDIDPIVPTMSNFDSLLIPPEHVSRSMSDTYYLDKETVLRTHTSAHQTTLLNAGEDRFLVTGDVYR